MNWAKVKGLLLASGREQEHHQEGGQGLVDVRCWVYAFRIETDQWLMYSKDLA